MFWHMLTGIIDITLIELAEERNNYRKQVETLKTQKQKLEGLCRALQAERQSSPADTGTADKSEVAVQQ